MSHVLYTYNKTSSSSWSENIVEHPVTQILIHLSGLFNHKPEHVFTGDLYLNQHSENISLWMETVQMLQNSVRVNNLEQCIMEVNNTAKLTVLQWIKYILKLYFL